MHGGTPGAPHGPASFTPSQRVLVELMASARRERSRRFAAQSKFFTDPGWDIFVDLAAAGLAGRLVSISSACLASLVPQTTALRYVRLLETEGLVERMQDASDGRRFLLSLTSKGWSTFHGYIGWLDERPSGLAPWIANAIASSEPYAASIRHLNGSGHPLRIRSTDGSRVENA